VDSVWILRTAETLTSGENNAVLERARSSAGEHTLHTGGVTGSIPVAPTTRLCQLEADLWVDIMQDDLPSSSTGRQIVRDIVRVG
jgi:hypothetical protein